MNTNLLAIVKHIAAEYGENVLCDPKRLKAFFGDLAKDEPKPLRLAFGRAVEEDAYNALKSAPDAAERAERKAAIAQKLLDEHGLDLGLSGEALDILEAALFGDEKPPLLCVSCGKALDAGWKACPYCGAACGMAAGAAAVPVPESAPPTEAAVAAPAPESAPLSEAAAAASVPENAPPQEAAATAPVPESAPLSEAAAAAPVPENAPPTEAAAPAKKNTKRNVLIAAGVALAVIVGVRVYQEQQRLAEVARVEAERAEAARAEAARIETALRAKMVWIPDGTFTMGSPTNEPEREADEWPQHQVKVSGFFMKKYEETQKEWREVMGSDPSYFKGDNLPVEQVSWYDVIEYCNRRSQLEGLTPAYTINGTDVHWNQNANGYRLPTEAEWEYACRAMTSGPFNMGNNITTYQANYDGNYPYNNNAKGVFREETVDVRNFMANLWGLNNMHGNVWEWCWDWYGDYTNEAQIDPVGPSTGAFRVGRGGSWFSVADGLRSAIRGRAAPSNRNNNVGFRLVRP
jgi:formylglycine-generating enzyme required for sulfatase activity